MSLRLDNDLLRRIDERRAQAPGGLNRSAWITAALDWVLTYLPTGIQNPERGRVANAAPEAVAGTKKVPPYGTEHFQDRPSHPGSPYPKSNGFQMGGAVEKTTNGKTERIDSDGVVHEK